ncbi:MAG: sensor domain-containing diguanylate cyclase [Actinomycetes bacterium]
MDARTLTVVLVVTIVVEAVVLFAQYRSNKAYQGLGWWAAGNAALAVGFVASAVRGESFAGHVAVALSLTLFVAGMSAVYVGVADFLEQRTDLRWVAAFVALFAVAICYLTFVDDLVAIRRSVVYLGVAIASAMSAWSLIHNRLPSVGRAAVFLFAVFSVNALLYAVLSVAELLGADAGKSLLADTPAYAAGLLVALATTMLWTFGLVIMINRRLSVDIDIERENLQRIFATSPDSTIISRLRDGMIVDVNQGFTRVTGYSRQDAVGNSSVQVPLWRHREERDKLVEMLLADGVCENFEAEFRRKDGTTINGIVSARLLSLHGEPHIIGVTRDITESKLLERKLKRQASTDSLTGVANRRHFLLATARELARSQRHSLPMSVALLDVDHFKDVNDTYGHSAGDGALVAIVSTLQAHIREIDIIGRLGGDEFAIMFPNTDAGQASLSVERCREALSEHPLQLGGDSVPVTFTGGVSTLSGEQETVDTMLARADRALYAAKDEGRNRVVVDPSRALPKPT